MRRSSSLRSGPEQYQRLFGRSCSGKRRLCQAGHEEDLDTTSVQRRRAGNTKAMGAMARKETGRGGERREKENILITFRS